MSKMKSAIIIGAGRISWQLEEDKLRYKPCTHLGAICKLRKKKINNYQVTAIQDKNRKKVHGAISFLSKYTKDRPEQVIGDNLELLQQKPDLLILTQSTDSHAKFLLEAIAHSIPKIVIEKPVCTTTEEATKIKEAARNSQSQIWVNYERRFLDRYLKLKHIIDDGLLGPSLFYRAFFSAPGEKLFPNQKSEGVLLHDTTHLVDLVQFLFGRTVKSDVVTSTNKHCLFLIHKDVEGEILTHCQADYFHFEIQVYFKKGRIRAINGAMYIEKSEPSKAYADFTSLSKPLTDKEPRITLERNPMIRLYTQVHNNAQTNMIQDACDNVILLNQGRL